MNKGFTLFAESIKGEELDFSASLKKLGRVLLGDIGGSMGPIYGQFFIEMSKVCKNSEYINGMIFGNMLNAALSGIKELGSAKVGDKTLIDCLEPATIAFNKALSEGKDFATCLNEMKSAAESGRDSTRDMIARIGRSSRLGERSRGVLDAGAASCCIILCAMADSIKKLL